MPILIYGMAWKEDDTERFTREVVQAGFCGFDIANQWRHYHEAVVGDVVRVALAANEMIREGLFLQTKFTFVSGQDQRLPYDPRVPVAEQVRQSFASSLEHLGVGYLDSFVLHGPSTAPGLGPPDWEAWESMEALQRGGQVRLIGVSNVNLGQLEEL